MDEPNSGVALRSARAPLRIATRDRRRNRRCTTRPVSARARVTGHVYLLRHGQDYKVGRSNDVARRRREVALLLPQDLEEVHRIDTDDPEGIERYWHERFKARHVRGEWFRLTADGLSCAATRKKPASRRIQTAASWANSATASSPVTMLKGVSHSVAVPLVSALQAEAVSVCAIVPNATPMNTGVSRLDTANIRANTCRARA